MIGMYTYKKSSLHVCKNMCIDQTIKYPNLISRWVYNCGFNYLSNS